MWVFISVDMVVVLLVGEEGEGGEGIVGGFVVARAVLKEVLLVGREVLRGGRCSFPSRSLSSSFRWSFRSD